MKRLAFLLTAALLLQACRSSEAEEEGVCSLELLPGDLVITEIMVNAKGKDEGLEWIEIYNASGTAQCLNGTLIYVQGATTSKKQHYITSENAVTIPANSYAVLGGGDFDYLSYSWAHDGTFNSGAFFDKSAEVSLRVGSNLIDAVAYGEMDIPTAPAPKEGKSLALCGECKAASCNDSIDKWQLGSGEAYDEAGNIGTPGMPNSDCQCQPCEGSATMRPPVPNELLITEVYANTPGKEDTNLEWFEVHVLATDASIDLTGLGILKEKDGEPVFEQQTCFAACPDSYVVFARNGNPEENGGLEADIVYDKLTLKNSDAYLGLSLNGDLIGYLEYPSATDGKSWQLDEAALAWCDAKGTYGDGTGFGSPGEPNWDCNSTICVDETGAEVTAAVPAPGDLEITEVLPNTPGGEEAEREWFEVRSTAAVPIQLNGLEIWKDPDGTKATHVVETEGLKCLTLEPGETAVFARSNDPVANGIPAESVAYVYASMTMSNSGYLGLKAGGVLVDSLNWTDAEDGAALQKDPVTGAWCDAVGQYWTTPGGDAAYGSPGQANLACGTAFCLDNGELRAVSPPGLGDLVISEIFANPAGQDLTAREWLEAYVTPAAMGRDLNGLELVVGGSSKGVVGEGSQECIPILQNYLVLARNADPVENGGLPADVVLVDGLSLENSNSTVSLEIAGKVIDSVAFAETTNGASLQLEPDALNATSNDDPGNWCDASVPFNGEPEYGSPGVANPACDASFCTDALGQAVQVTPPVPEGLFISEIFPNTMGTEDPDKEWFEVTVPTSASPFELNGTGIILEAGEPAYYFSVDECIELEPGGIYLFCRNGKPGQNGGLPACIEYGSSVSLINDYGSLGLGIPGIIYDSVPDYGKSQDGISRQLHPDSYNASGNDDPNNWCDTPAGNTFGDGSVVGTPGIQNPACAD